MPEISSFAGRPPRATATRPACRGGRSRGLAGAVALVLLAPIGALAQSLLQEAQLALIRQGQVAAQTAASVVAARATDTDNDGTLEPPAMLPTSGPAPLGGGWLPIGSTLSTTDGRGIPFGYCAWDHGTTRAAVAAGWIPAANSTGDGPMVAVIYAGPNRVFDTSCAWLAGGGSAAGDDFVAVRDLSQSVLTSGVSFSRPPVDSALNTGSGSSLRSLLSRPGDLVDGELRLVKENNTLWRYSATGVPPARSITSDGEVPEGTLFAQPGQAHFAPISVASNNVFTPGGAGVNGGDKPGSPGNEVDSLTVRQRFTVLGGGALPALELNTNSIAQPEGLPLLMVRVPVRMEEGFATAKATITGGSISGVEGTFRGLASAGSTNLNTTGAAATNIGNAESATTLLGTLQLNVTGNNATVIGNSKSSTSIDGLLTVRGLAVLSAGLQTENAVILGGAIEATAIGAKSPSIGRFTELTALGATTLDGVAIGSGGMAGSIRIGAQALVSAGEGASGNTALGVGAMAGLSTGQNNTALGMNAGSLIGAGTSVKSATGSLFIGADARPQADGQTNQIVIGHGSRGRGSNTVTIGNSAIVGNYFSGTVYASEVALTSDARLKTDVTPLAAAMAVLEALQAVSYRWNPLTAAPGVASDSGRQFGVIAQQVEGVLPELVNTDAAGWKSVNYTGFIPFLLQGAKEQQAQLRSLDAQVTLHGERLDEQESRLEGHGRRIGRAERLIGRLEEGFAGFELRMGEAEQRLATLMERADAAEGFMARFDTSRADTLALAVPNFQVSNLTAERAKIDELVARSVQAEEARFRRVDADESHVTGKIQAQRVVSGERALFVAYGTIAPLFDVPEGAHFAVTVTSADGSYATATVLRAGGQLRVVPSASHGIDVVAQGTQVGIMAPSRRVKASWLRTG